MMQVANSENQTDKGQLGQDAAMRQDPETLTEPKRHLPRSNQALLRSGRAGAMPPQPPLRPSQTIRLQRKCACGSPAMSGGECEECKAKKGLPLQTKLTIGEPGDSYEQEADRVAEQVMAAPAHSAVSAVPPRIHRFSGQSSEGMDTAPDSVDRVLASSGRPLEPTLRQDMEQRFGYDLSSVRVHSGAAAEKSARDVNANAYTVGHDIVFGAGRFAPDAHAGRRLLAHELVHVVQQGGATGLGRTNAPGTVSTQLLHRDPKAGAVAAAAPSPPSWLGSWKSKATHVKGNIWDLKLPSMGGDSWVGPYRELAPYIEMQGLGAELDAAHIIGGEHLEDLGSLLSYNDATCIAAPKGVHVGWTDNTSALQAKYFGGRSSNKPGRVWGRTEIGPKDVDYLYHELYRGKPELQEFARNIVKGVIDSKMAGPGPSGGGPGGARPVAETEPTLIEGRGSPATEIAAPPPAQGINATRGAVEQSTKKAVTEATIEVKQTAKKAGAKATKKAGHASPAPKPEGSPMPEPTPTTTAEAPLTEATVAKELALVTKGRGRAILGKIALVGGKAFAVLKVGGTLFTIFSLTQIRSLSDAGAFVASLVVGEVVGEGIALYVKSARLGTGVGLLATFALSLEDNQPSEYDMRLMQVDQFLAKNFTWEEIQKNYMMLRPQAYSLLFDTKPFELVPTLQENIRSSFERCMNQTSVPVAAGVEAAEEKRNEALEKCSLKTGYRENIECTESGCSPAKNYPQHNLVCTEFGCAFDEVMRLVHKETAEIKAHLMTGGDKRAGTLVVIDNLAIVQQTIDPKEALKALRNCLSVLDDEYYYPYPNLKSMQDRLESAR